MLSLTALHSLVTFWVPPFRHSVQGGCSPHFSDNWDHLVENEVCGFPGRNNACIRKEGGEEEASYNKLWVCKKVSHHGHKKNFRGAQSRLPRNSTEPAGPSFLGRGGARFFLSTCSYIFVPEPREPVIFENGRIGNGSCNLKTRLPEV